MRHNPVSAQRKVSLTFCDCHHICNPFGLVEFGEVLCNKVLLSRENQVLGWIAGLLTSPVEHHDPRQERLQNAKMIHEEDKNKETLVKFSPKFKVAT